MIEALDRQYGLYQMSIGTSLAIESLFHTGTFENAEGTPPYTKVDELLINIRTLIRNAYQAFDYSAQPNLATATIYDSIIEDIDDIAETIADKSSTMTVTYYNCSYDTIRSVGKSVGANVLINTALRAIDYELIEKAVYDRIKRERPNLITEFDSIINPAKKANDCVVLTHYPFDLMSNSKFTSLKLLESRTGKIKDRREWGSKLNNPKEVDNLPFNTVTMMICGDNTLFRPLGTKVKKALKEAAVKYNWTQNTTYDRVITDIKLFGNSDLLECVRKLTNVRSKLK